MLMFSKLMFAGQFLDNLSDIDTARPSSCRSSQPKFLASPNFLAPAQQHPQGPQRDVWFAHRGLQRPVVRGWLSAACTCLRVQWRSMFWNEPSSTSLQGTLFVGCSASSVGIKTSSNDGRIRQRHPCFQRKLHGLIFFLKLGSGCLFLTQV